jgi:hypothetical protein
MMLEAEHNKEMQIAQLLEEVERQEKKKKKLECHRLV